MKSVRTILWSFALVATIYAVNPAVARADYGTVRVDAVRQADWNISSAQQALDAARANQATADSAYRRAAARANSDFQRVTDLDRSLASLQENLVNAERAVEIRRIAQGTIRQRFDAASAAAQNAFNALIARQQQASPEYRRAELAVQEAQRHVSKSLDALIAWLGNPSSVSQSSAADELARNVDALRAATEARQRIADTLTRGSIVESELGNANRAIERERANLDSIAAELARADAERAAVAGSVARAQTDASDARARLAASQQSASAARAALDNANQAAAQAQANLDSAYSYASYVRAQREREIAAAAWPPPAPIIVVAATPPPPPARVIVVKPAHHNHRSRYGR